MRLDYGCCGVSVIRHAEEGRSYRGSFVEHRLSGVGEAEQSGIEDDADVAAYGAERHAGRCHELHCRRVLVRQNSFAHLRPGGRRTLRRLR